MNATSIMTATSTMTTAVTAAESVDKISAMAKVKNFVGTHKTAFAVVTTAIVAVPSGILISKGTSKLKSKLKSKKDDEQSA